MGRLGGLLAWGAILSTAVVTVACTQDIEGLRTPRSPASQSLGIRWHQGFQASYQWQLTRDFSVFVNQPMQSTVAGNCDLIVLSVGADGVALVQFTVKIDPQYTNGNGPVTTTSIIGVGPRGRVTSNPDDQFGDLDRFYTALPLLPPAGSSSGASWYESYKLPNPLYGNTRDLYVNGQYIRDEGAGFMRTVVIQAHMTVSFNDSAPYENLYGPPPSGAPAHIEEHMSGKQIVDVTYRFDPARQSLTKSTATFQVDQTETFTDATNGQTVGNRNSYVGTDTMTFSRI